MTKAIEKINKRIKRITALKTYKKKINTVFHDYRDYEIELKHLERLKKEIKKNKLSDFHKELYPQYFKHKEQ